MSFTYSAKSAAFNVNAGQDHYTFHCTGGAWTMGSNAGAAGNESLTIGVTNASTTGDITFTPDTNQKVDGGTSYVIEPGESQQFTLNGSDDWISKWSASGGAGSDGTSQRYNAQWFGTTGTNDTDALQAAINATPRGGTLFLPPGTFEVTTLTVPTQIKIKGSGWGRSGSASYGVRPPYNSAGYGVDALRHGTVIRSTATTGTALALGTSAREIEAGWVLEDLIIQGPGSGSTVGLSLDTVLESSVRNVCIANFSVGLKGLGGNNENNFHDLPIWACETGIQSLVHNNNDWRFFGLTIHNCGDCIELRGGRGWRVFGWMAQSYSGTALIFDTDTDKNVITGVERINPIKIKSVGHNLATGDHTFITDVTGTVELNDKPYTVTYVNADHFTLDGVNGESGYSAYDTGGQAGLEISDNTFQGAFVENPSSPTSFIKIIGNNIQFLGFADIKGRNVGDFDLTGGTNNDRHWFQGMYFTEARPVLAIPSNMSNVRVERHNLGDATYSEASNNIALEMTGSFTGTLTGGLTSPTGTIKWTREGRLVTMEIPTITVENDTGDNSCTITGVDDEVTPQSTTSWMVVRILNEDADQFGMAQVTSAGVITLLSNSAGAVFGKTAAKNKGIKNCSITYKM